ncbi:MAG: SDR family oxidoreductase [Rhodobiaceae bacterium]|nr:SDR family oxidoreductase [Rhodobiaceae bacterium]
MTGAGSSGPGVGTGKAISVLFAREGAHVLLMDINETAVAETMDMIAAEGGSASVFIGDVTRSEDCAMAAEAAMDRYGKLTTLVNNVATPHMADVIDCEEADWDRVLSVNLRSAMLMSKFAIPKMRECGGGSITNISSVVALRGYPAQTAYTAAKGGMVSLTRSWAIDQGRHSIRVNCICPGSLYTPIAVKYFGMTEKERAYRASMNPLGLEGTAWDVAWAAVFLASDEARWISGVTLPVDGGDTVGAPRWGSAPSAMEA